MAITPLGVIGPNSKCRWSIVDHRKGREKLVMFWLRIKSIGACIIYAWTEIERKTVESSGDVGIIYCREENTSSPGSSANVGRKRGVPVSGAVGSAESWNIQEKCSKTETIRRIGRHLSSRVVWSGNSHHIEYRPPLTFTNE